MTNGLGRRTWRLFALLVAFALVASACGSSDDDESGSDTAADTSVDTGAAEEPAAEPAADEPADTDADEPDEPEGDDDTIGIEEIVDEAGLDPVAGGTLRFGINAESDGLNPTTSALSAPGLTMGNAVFDTLAAYDTDGNVLPYLAEAFTPNDDFSSWTVKLREGVTFHDGTPLNSDAVIVNFSTQRDDPLVGLAVRPFVLEGDAGIEKVDDLSYIVHLTEPNQFWPTSVTGQLGMVASPTWLAAALEDPELNQEPVGTGPYVFENRSQDSSTTFVRNENWWNGEVLLDAVEFVIVTDPDSRLNLFLEGALDGVHDNNPGTIDVYRNEDGVQNALDDTASEQLDLINTQNPPFDDIRARQALTFATPQNNYVTLLGVGVAQRADSMYATSSPYFNPDVVQETDQPDRAVELAAEYCADVPESCTDNKINISRTFSGPSVAQTREAELLAEGWSVAFNVSFDEVAEDSIILNVAIGQYQVADWRQFGAVDPSVDNVWMMCRTIGGISLNWPRFCNEERDALLLQAQNTTDLDERAALYQELSAQVQQDYTYLFHIHTVWDIAYAEHVKGACTRTAPDSDAELRCSIAGRTFYDGLWIQE